MRAFRDASRLAEAESLILEAKDIFTRRYGEDDGPTISTDSSLATLALARGDPAGAETLFRQALELARKRWGANAPRLASLVTCIDEARAAARVE